MSALSAAPALLDILKKSAAYLAQKGIDEARLDAEYLFAQVLGMQRLELYLAFDRPLSESELADLRALVRRRAAREPLQYILGNQPFRQVALAVTPATLIPRPETEEVVAWALAEGDRLARDDAPLQVLDIGTGSGCIAIAYAAERPDAQVTAVDVSAAALAVAQENVQANGVGERVTLLHGDLFAPLAAGVRFGLLISNPPYLTSAEWEAAQPEVRDHEPKSALAAGVDGLDVYRRLFASAHTVLTENGTVVVEIGATQGDTVTALAVDAGFEQVVVHHDFAGRARCVVARQWPVGDG